MSIDDDALLRHILENHRIIAMVGLSPREDRPSHIVACYLMARGYTVIPVNPGHKEILGQPCYPDLKSIPVKVDMVDVFRQADEVPPLADEAIAIGAKSLWMQLGVVSPRADETARAAGLSVVMDRCVKIEHARLGINSP